MKRCRTTAQLIDVWKTVVVEFAPHKDECMRQYSVSQLTDAPMDGCLIDDPAQARGLDVRVPNLGANGEAKFAHAFAPGLGACTELFECTVATIWRHRALSGRGLTRTGASRIP